jgi:hypothetical protein
MKLIEKLREIIHPDFKKSPKSPGFFILEEAKVAGFPPTNLTFHSKMPFLPCVFDVSDSNRLFQIFDISHPKLSSICDYILFYEKKSRRKKEPKLFVFLCNLKSNSGNNSGLQIKSSAVLADFMIKTAIRLLDYASFEVEFRALKIDTKSTTKFTTNVRTEQKGWQPLGKSGILQKDFKAGSTMNLHFLAQ